MHFRSTLILCVIAVLAVSASIIVNRARGQATEDGRAAAPLLVEPLAPERIDRMTLERRGKPPLVFERIGDAWEQTAPFRHPLDAHSMHQFIVLANDLRRVSTIEADALGTDLTLATLGLDPPLATLRYAGPEQERTLIFGRRGIGGLGYLRLAGEEPVYVVKHALHERAVDMEPKEWRDRTLFPGASIDADRVEIVSGEESTVLVRDRKQWRMESPARSRLSDIARDEYFQALGRSRSAGFIVDEPGDLARFGLAEPAGELSVTTTDGPAGPPETTRRLLVGARIGVGTQDRFAMIEGRDTIVRLPEAVLAALFRRPHLLVAPTASGTPAADVKAIVVRGPAGTFRLERDLDRWVAPEWDDQQVSRNAVEQLLAALTEARASEVAIEAYPRDLELATVTFHGFDARPIDTVRIAREPGPDGTGGRWALENGDGVLRIFPAGLDLKLRPERYGLEPRD